MEAELDYKEQYLESPCLVTLTFPRMEKLAQLEEQGGKMKGLKRIEYSWIIGSNLWIMKTY